MRCLEESVVVRKRTDALTLVIEDALPAAILAFILVGRPEFKVVGGRDAADTDLQRVRVAVEIGPATSRFQGSTWLAGNIADSDFRVTPQQLGHCAGRTRRADKRREPCRIAGTAQPPLPSQRVLSLPDAGLNGAEARLVVRLEYQPALECKVGVGHIVVDIELQRNRQNVSCRRRGCLVS